MSTYDRHVLFVDDDPDMRELIESLLKPRGIQITTATDGLDALQKMEAGLRPDVIIADLEMPNMDGLTFFQKVRANDDWLMIPFIMLSAHDEKPSRRRALMLGVDDYLCKPLDEERLFLSIYSKVRRTQELTRYAEAAHETLEYIRRDMARMFTHELRTPLVSLNMVAEMLSKYAGDLTAEDAQELIGTLQAGVTRYNRLVEQMVLLVQLDTGALQNFIQEAARPGLLWDALIAAVNLARRFSYRQRDVEVQYHPGNVTVEIVAEWKSLSHALAELLSNAMSFSPKGQPVVVSQRTEGGEVVLRITDQGPGIPEEKKRDLFRRFNQLERDKHEQQGVGIGLYLARNIIEAAGGSLLLDSKPGQGTTVTVRFPIAKASAEPLEAPPTSTGATEAPA